MACWVEVHVSLWTDSKFRAHYTRKVKIQKSHAAPIETGTSFPPDDKCIQIHGMNCLFFFLFVCRTPNQYPTNRKIKEKKATRRDRSYLLSSSPIRLQLHVDLRRTFFLTRIQRAGASEAADDDDSWAAPMPDIDHRAEPSRLRDGSWDLTTNAQPCTCTTGRVVSDPMERLFVGFMRRPNWVTSEISWAWAHYRGPNDDPHGQMLLAWPIRQNGPPIPCEIEGWQARGSESLFVASIYRFDQTS